MAREAEVRETEKRETETRAPVWTPPSTLDAPPPREGFIQRWVSTSVLGKEMPHHVSKRFREGWEPRKANTVKDFHVPKLDSGQYAGCIGVEGMILCEMPVEMAKSRGEYFARKTREQEGFVDAQLSNVEHASMPIHRDSSSSVSRGRKLPIADD